MVDERKTVLVIDDQEDERAIQRAMLGHLGYAVQEAEDGQVGLHTARDARPDLILLDVAMPREDGFTICRKLRADERTAAIPVLLFTASVASDLDEKARDAGADGVLTKPVDPRRVASEVRRLIGPPAG